MNLQQTVAEPQGWLGWQGSSTMEIVAAARARQEEVIHAQSLRRRARLDLKHHLYEKSY